MSAESPDVAETGDARARAFAPTTNQVKAIAALTESGSTALWMSRLHCGVPIYALTPSVATSPKKMNTNSSPSPR